MRSFLVVGGGGREAVFAARLARDSRVFGMASHENPLIHDIAVRTGGAYGVGNQDDPRIVVEFAKRHRIDYTFVNADAPLANGVVDELLAAGLRAVGARKEAARIEWDKMYAMDLMRQVRPQNTPFYMVVNGKNLDGAMERFESNGMSVVVKPRGLTGGKGVKVMPEHLATYMDCKNYATEILKREPDVLLVEKLDGIEFTIMGLTDGRHLEIAPASYDYPFRFEGDRGAGTGGMGCFTCPDGSLPFLSGSDLSECKNIMQDVIDAMRDAGVTFSGVLNGGFFKTVQGIRFMEFNSRFGDPEGLNVLSVLEGSLADVLEWIYDGRLGRVQFREEACVTKYLVAKEYPGPSPDAIRFTVDEGALGGMGVDFIPASCIRKDDGIFETLKRSRVAALGARAPTVEEASQIVDGAIDSHVAGRLEFRRDIGSKESLARLREAAAHMIKIS